MAEGLLPPPGPAEFETTDPAAAQEYLSQTYGTRIRMSGTLDGKVLRHSRAAAGSFRVDDVHLPLDLGFAVAPLGALVVVELRAGTMERDCGGVTSRLSAGDVFISSQPDLPCTSVTHCVRTRSTMLDLAALSRVASTGPGHGPVRFTSLRPVSAAAAWHWIDITRYVRAGLLANPEASAQPMLVAGVRHLLATTALVTFPNTAITHPTAQDRQDASSATLQRAVGFIEGNAGLDISLAEIAAAAHVTIRTVQLAFRRHLGVTPTQYLRRVRLDHAHQELLGADPADSTVTAVSARWGFASSSRFAAYYYRAYGIHPSQTLKS
ncbi:MAG: helix-turn-helix transcriptional regulator [Actinomycetota bacterium]